MIDKRIGKRIKERREALGMTQEQFAEKAGLTTNYISTIERGASFPRYDKLITILNALETSADSIFCDVVTASGLYRECLLSQQLEGLPANSRQRILQMLELMIQQEKSSLP